MPVAEAECGGRRIHTIAMPWRWQALDVRRLRAALGVHLPRGPSVRAALAQGRWEPATPGGSRAASAATGHGSPSVVTAPGGSGGDDGSDGVRWGRWLLVAVAVAVASPALVAWAGRRQHDELRATILAMADGGGGGSEGEGMVGGEGGDLNALGAAAATAAKWARLGCRVEYLTWMLLDSWGVAAAEWQMRQLVSIMTRELDVDMLWAAGLLQRGAWDAAAPPMTIALGRAIARQRQLLRVTEHWTRPPARLAREGEAMGMLRSAGFFRRVALLLDWLRAVDGNDGGVGAGTALPLLDALLNQYPNVVANPALVQTAAAALGPGDHTVHVPADEVVGALAGPDMTQLCANAVMYALTDGDVHAAAPQPALSLLLLAEGAITALALRYALAQAPTALSKRGGGALAGSQAHGGGELNRRPLVIPVGGVPPTHTIPITLHVTARPPHTAAAAASPPSALASSGINAAAVAGATPYDAVDGESEWLVTLPAVASLRARARHLLSQIDPAIPAGRHVHIPGLGAVGFSSQQGGANGEGAWAGEMNPMFRHSLALWPLPIIAARPAALCRELDASPAITMGDGGVPPQLMPIITAATTTIHPPAVAPLVPTTVRACVAHGKRALLSRVRAMPTGGVQDWRWEEEAAHVWMNTVMPRIAMQLATARRTTPTAAWQALTSDAATATALARELAAGWTALAGPGLACGLETPSPVPASMVGGGMSAQGRAFVMEAACDTLWKVRVPLWSVAAGTIVARQGARAVSRMSEGEWVDAVLVEACRLEEAATTTIQEAVAREVHASSASAMSTPSNETTLTRDEAAALMAVSQRSTETEALGEVCARQGAPIPTPLPWVSLGRILLPALMAGPGLGEEQEGRGGHGQAVAQERHDLVQLWLQHQDTVRRTIVQLRTAA